MGRKEEEGGEGRDQEKGKGREGKGEGKGGEGGQGWEGKLRGLGEREGKRVGKRGGEGIFRGGGQVPPPMFFPRTAPGHIVQMTFTSYRSCYS